MVELCLLDHFLKRNVYWSIDLTRLVGFRKFCDFIVIAFYSIMH